MHPILNTICDVDSISRDDTDNKYHCPTCYAAFTRRSNLRRHYAIHTRLLGFKCDACSKAFARSDQLRFHAHHCLMRPTSSSNISVDAQALSWDPRPPTNNPPFRVDPMVDGLSRRNVSRRSNPSHRPSTRPANPATQYSSNIHGSHPACYPIHPDSDIQNKSGHSHQHVFPDDTNAFYDFQSSSPPSSSNVIELSGSVYDPYSTSLCHDPTLQFPMQDSVNSTYSPGDWSQTRYGTPTSLYSSDSDGSVSSFQDTSSSPYHHASSAGSESPPAQSFGQYTVSSEMKIQAGLNKERSRSRSLSNDISPVMYTSQQVEEMLGAMSSSLVGSMGSALQQTLHPHHEPRYDVNFGHPSSANDLRPQLQISQWV